MVLVGKVAQMVDLIVLRAAGALRMINTVTRNPRLTNTLAERLVEGMSLERGGARALPGVAAYWPIFQELRALLHPQHQRGRAFDWLRRGRRPRTCCPSGCPRTTQSIMPRGSSRIGQIRDLSDGRHRLADVLAAFEWRRSVLPWFADQGYGDKVLVDISGTSMEEWCSSPAHALAAAYWR